MSGSVRLLGAAGVALMLGMGLAACSHANLAAALPEPSSSNRIFDDLTSDSGGAKRAPASAPRTSGGAEIYAAAAEGAKGEGAEPAGKDGARASRDGINLNFENAEIKTVARAILGDVLSLNYAVDPRVSGTITLSTRRPVPRADTLSLLETALRAQGAVVVQQSGVYRILPDKEAAGASGANVGRKAKGEGYAITAMPLENISAEALLKILDGFGTRPRAARVDPERNLLIVQGTLAERQSVIDTALAFDVDWMRNQSVGVFPLHSSSPDAVIRELGRMVDQSSVQFQPIERMNAVLAVSRSAEAIRRVATWINRLDRINDAGARVRVYRLKYADARRVANVVKEVFGGGSGQSLGATSKQVAPGMGTVGARSGAATTSGFTPDAARADARQSASAESTDEPGFGEATPNGKLRITADPENNAVVVYASEAQAKQIEQAIQDLDLAPLQVAIEATIAEVSLNDTLRNGVQFFLSSKNLGFRKDSGSVGSLVDGLPLSRVVPGLNFLLGSESSPKLVLDALRDVTEVKIISSPSLVVVNNQPAILQVGDQVPVTTRSAQAVENSPTAPVVNSIDFRDTGVILRVIPRVHPDSMIGIDIEQEISSVKDAANADSLTPTISQRRVKSKVSVADGQTLLIGGLMSEQRTKSKSGIPGINDIPVIGELLAGMHKSETVQTELIIFIKPRVLRDSNDARRLAEDLRQRMKGLNRW